MARPADKLRERALAQSFFAPASVAVIGAGRRPTNVGHVIFANLIATYGGRVYPVNPKTEQILGRTCYKDLASLPESPELAIVAVPAGAAPGVIEQLSRVGCGSAVLVSAGFKETGIEGGRLEEELVAAARRGGVRFVGPNCLGLMDTNVKLNASFAGDLPPKGHIGFMSQSGALCTAILDWAKGESVGFSRFASLGNKADIDETEMLDLFFEDEETRVIAIYMEGTSDGRRFMDAARKAGSTKPVIAIKSGATTAGARAVSSHTGTLAGSQAVYRAAFRQSGVIQAETMEELFDFAIAFSRQPVPSGGRVAIVTNAGGPGIIATDACERNGLLLAALSDETLSSLRTVLPPAASFYNPVDVLGDASAERFSKALRLVLADPGVDIVVALVTPQGLTDIEGTAIAVAEAARGAKPVLSSFMGQKEIAKGLAILRESGVPNYPFPERAVRAAAAMADFGRGPVTERRAVVYEARDKSTTRELLTEASKRDEINIGNLEGGAIVESYGIEVPPMGLARGLEQCRRLAGSIGYPLVLKVSSPDILHKSDVGAIVAGVANERELETAFETLRANVDRFMPEAAIQGTLVQGMVHGAREVIVGVNKDPQFGPVVMFGLGGIYVEILGDVAFRVAPVDPETAMEMIRETKAYGLLLGARGRARADIDCLSHTISRLSQLAVDFPQIAEVEINPLMVKAEGQGCLAADVRLVLRPGTRGE